MFMDSSKTSLTVSSILSCSGHQLCSFTWDQIQIHQQGFISSSHLPLIGLSLYGLALCKPKRWLWCGENVSRSAAVCETLRPAARLGSTSNHQSSKSLRCPSIASLMIALNFCRSSSTMFTCMNALGCCWAHVIGWWAICVDKILNIVTNKVFFTVGLVRQHISLWHKNSNDSN